MITNKIQNIVEKLLRDDEICRDNDSHLVASIWWNETKNITNKNTQNQTERVENLDYFLNDDEINRDR